MCNCAVAELPTTVSASPSCCCCLTHYACNQLCLQQLKYTLIGDTAQPSLEGKVCGILQGRSSELQQIQAKVSSNEGILKDCNKDLNLKRSEMDDLRMQLKQGLGRVYGQVSFLASNLLDNSDETSHSFLQLKTSV